MRDTQRSSQLELRGRDFRERENQTGSIGDEIKKKVKREETKTRLNRDRGDSGENYKT